MIYYIVGAILLVLVVVYLCFYKQINYFVIQKSGKKRIQRKLYRTCKINNYLIMSDIQLPIEDNKAKKVDTIIIGNKYIYVTKQVVSKGEMIANNDDLKWRIINNEKLVNIDNPYAYNDRIINRLSNIIDNIDKDRIINLVVISKTLKATGTIKMFPCYIVDEDDVIDFITETENNSSLSNLDNNIQEKIAMTIYKAGIKTEKIIEKNR